MDTTDLVPDGDDPLAKPESVDVWEFGDRGGNGAFLWVRNPGQFVDDVPEPSSKFGFGNVVFMEVYEVVDDGVPEPVLQTLGIEYHSVDGTHQFLVGICPFVIHADL